jgi:hypothetical protein
MGHVSKLGVLATAVKQARAAIKGAAAGLPAVPLPRIGAPTAGIMAAAAPSLAAATAGTSLILFVPALARHQGDSTMPWGMPFVCLISKANHDAEIVSFGELQLPAKLLLA